MLSRLQNLFHLSGSLDRYGMLANAPRGQIVSPSALVEFVNDMDDLVLQFDTTPTGHRFMEAWKRARIIVDVSGSNGGGEEKPTPPPAPEQPK